MFEPDANQTNKEDQLVDALAEAIYLVARQALKNKQAEVGDQSTFT